MGRKMKLLAFLFLCCAGTSFGDEIEDSTPGNPIDKICHSNLFDEAVELLSTQTVKRLEKQILENENALKEKEEKIEMLKLELEKKQQEMEKSWTLVSYMMNVISSSQEMMRSKEDLVVTQAAKIEEMAEQISESTRRTEDSFRRLNISIGVIEAQERTISGLRKAVTEDSKLSDTYGRLQEGNLLQTNCDAPPYLSLMTDSLNSQQEQISELKAVLQEEDTVKTLLSNITREMDYLGGSIQATHENWEVLRSCQGLVQKQSEGLDILRILANHAVTRNSSLRYKEDDSGQILSAELCQCIPDPPANQTVTLTLIRDEDTIHPQWSSWQYDQCQGMQLPNGTFLPECGEGKKERRRLKDINSNKWEEEVEEVTCPSCPQFL